MVKLSDLLAHSVLVVPCVETSSGKVGEAVLNLHWLRDLLGVKVKKLIGEEHFTYYLQF